MNRTVENIGARRLSTIIERIVDEVSYRATEMEKGSQVNIDREFVHKKVGDLLKTQDLAKFIL